MNELLSIVDATGETRMKIEQAHALCEIIIDSYFNSARQFKENQQVCYNMDTLLGLVLEALNRAKEAERIADALSEADKQPADEAHAPAGRGHTTQEGGNVHVG